MNSLVVAVSDTWWLVGLVCFGTSFLFLFSAGMLPVWLNGLFTRLGLASFCLVFAMMAIMFSMIETGGVMTMTHRWWAFGLVIGIPLVMLLQPISLHMAPWVKGTDPGKDASGGTFLIVGKKYLLDGQTEWSD